jgi:hypothetical protein
MEDVDPSSNSNENKYLPKHVFDKPKPKPLNTEEKLGFNFEDDNE